MVVIQVVWVMEASLHARLLLVAEWEVYAHIVPTLYLHCTYICTGDSAKGWRPAMDPVPTALSPFSFFICWKMVP